MLVGTSQRLSLSEVMYGKDIHKKNEVVFLEIKLKSISLQ